MLNNWAKQWNRLPHTFFNMGVNRKHFFSQTGQIWVLLVDAFYDGQYILWRHFTIEWMFHVMTSLSPLSLTFLYPCYNTQDPIRHGLNPQINDPGGADLLPDNIEVCLWCCKCECLLLPATLWLWWWLWPCGLSVDMVTTSSDSGMGDMSPSVPSSHCSQISGFSDSVDSQLESPTWFPEFWLCNIFVVLLFSVPEWLSSTSLLVKVSIQSPWV